MPSLLSKQNAETSDILSVPACDGKQDTKKKYQQATQSLTQALCFQSSWAGAACIMSAAARPHPSRLMHILCASVRAKRKPYYRRNPCNMIIDRERFAYPKWEKLENCVLSSRRTYCISNTAILQILKSNSKGTWFLWLSARSSQDFCVFYSTMETQLFRRLGDALREEKIGRPCFKRVKVPGPAVEIHVLWSSLPWQTAEAVLQLLGSLSSRLTVSLG